MARYSEEICFSYHPGRPEDIRAFKAVREKAKELALVLRDECPPSRELSTARTKLEECVMHANAAIARQQAFLGLLSKKDDLDAAVVEAERIAKVRAENPGAKNQTIGSG